MKTRKYLYVISTLIIIIITYIMYISYVYTTEGFENNSVHDNLHLFEVYEYSNKKRLGANNDGGYVTGNIDTQYDCYLSCGVSNEESFSRDFINNHKYIGKENSFAFDGTIQDYPWHYTRDINFINKNINNYNNDKNTDMRDILDKYNNIFLKMDIEGGEYPWLQSLSENELNKIAQIVMEVHDLDKFDNIKKECFNKLKNTHYLIHVHGNNYGDITNSIPHVLELTYINKKLFSTTPAFNKQSMPIHNLDFPNNISVPDYSFDKYPFVSLP